MPIDFNCPSCSKLLRVPDEVAGRQAKCPQCGSVIVVPAASQPAPPVSGSGFPPPSAPPVPPSSGPMSDDEEFRLAPPMPTPTYKPTPTSSYRPSGDNPFASPAPAAQVELPMGDGDGPPWERNGPSVNSFIETVKLVFTKPNEMFATMRTEGGLGLPIGFLVVGGWIGQAFGTLYGVGQKMIIGQAIAPRRGAPNPFEMYAMSTSMMIVLLVIAPILIILGMFIYAGIYHVLLMMLDGARKPFETTARVYAYAAGSCSLLMVIPCAGAYALLIANIVYMIIGLSKAHGISGGKAAAAVLIPFAILCGCGIALGFAFAGMAINAARH